MAICLILIQFVNNNEKRRKIIDMDMLEIWNQVLENLEGNVSPVGFNIHIKTAVPVCFENSTFTISVATSINKNLVEYRYKKYIESSLEKVTGAKISLAVLVGDANELKQEIESKQNSEYDNSEIISSDGLNSKYTFENFVQGSSNLYAQSKLPIIRVKAIILFLFTVTADLEKHT